MQPCLSTDPDRQTAVCPRHIMSLSSFYSVLLSYPLSLSEFYLQCTQSTELDWGQPLCRFEMQSGWEQNPLFSLTGWSELQSCSPSPCLTSGKVVHPEGVDEGRVTDQLFAEFHLCVLSEPESASRVWNSFLFGS